MDRPRSRRQVLKMGLLLTLVVLAMSACGGGGSGGEQAAQKKTAPEGTFELPNGRSLYMECRGTALLPSSLKWD